MSESTYQVWGRLERWSVGAFVAAGALFVVFAGLWAAFAFTDMASESTQNVVGPAGWTAAFIGLLGLYPQLAGGDGRLPEIAAVFAGLGCIGGVITAVGNLGTLLGMVGTLPAWFDALQLLLLVGIIPGFLTYAFIILTRRDGLRRLGVLLVLPAGIFAVNVVRVATLGSTTPRWSPFVLGAAQALTLLAIGYTTHTVSGRANEPAPLEGRLAR